MTAASTSMKWHNIIEHTQITFRSEAHAKGFSDYFEGISRDDNPYLDCDKYYEWEQGWNDSVRMQCSNNGKEGRV